MSPSVHVDNKEKYILILDEVSTQGLDGATLTAGKNFINFTENNMKFCLSFHYNGSNSYLFGNGTEIIEFKVKNFETVAIPLFLRNIWKDFSIDNMKKGWIKWTCLWLYYDSIAVDDTLDILKYLMKKNGMI